MGFNTNKAVVSEETKLVYGIDKGSVKLLPFVNLSNEEKKKLGLKTFDNETEWIMDKEDKETGEKYKTVTIELYYKVVSSSLEIMNGKIFPIRFYVDNIIRPESRNTGKKQYINKFTEAEWLENENSETKFMSNKEGIRRALKGEVDFMDNLKDMLGLRNGIEYFDWNKIFNGNFTEIRETIKDALTFLKEKGKERKFTVMYYVQRKEKEIQKEDGTSETKTFYIQQIYNKAFTERKIRRNIEYSKNNGYPLNGIYEKEGVLVNYLSIFDRTEYEQNNNTNEEVDDLPF